MGGPLEENDVDGGATTLFTPTMDLSAFDDATVSYYRWFSNGTGAERDGTGAEPNTELFTVGISDDGGLNWTTVEVVGPTGPDAVGGWIFHEFNVAAFVTPTAQVMMRFVAADTGNESVVEAAIDDLLVTALTVADTDGDGVCDADDICPGGDDTVDTNENGIPDECDAHTPLPAASPYDRKKNRYLSFDPNNTDIAVALRVTMTASLNHPDAVGTAMWVGAPDAAGLAILSTTPVIRLWPEAAIHATGCFVSPVATYDVQAMIAEGALPTDPLSIDTIDQPGGGKFWGDTVGFFTGTEWTPPQGIVNFDDVVAVNKTFQGAFGAPHVSVSDVEPQFINRVVNINDVFRVISAFQANPYPFGCPADACQDNLVNPCP